MSLNKSIKDWMVSHDNHFQGIRYRSCNIEDEEAFPLEGFVDPESMESVENIIDESRELAKIFVSRLSEYEVCACAILYGNGYKFDPNRALSIKEKENIKRLLSAIFDEFIQDYPVLAMSNRLRSIFSQSVTEICDDIYRRKL